MNKLILLILLSTTLLFSCNMENRKPEFKRVENVQIKSLNATVAEINADAIVYNPNGVSVYLNKSDIDVFANGIKISHITQTNQTEITKKSEFNIPLKAKLKLIDLIKDEKSILNLINSSLSGLKDKKIDLKFTGNAEFELAGIKFDVPIEHEEVVKLK